MFIQKPKDNAKIKVNNKTVNNFRERQSKALQGRFYICIFGLGFCLNDLNLFELSPLKVLLAPGCNVLEIME